MLTEVWRFRSGGVELTATIAGTGPPLLLLHGFPDWPKSGGSNYPSSSPPVTA